MKEKSTDKQMEARKKALSKARFYTHLLFYILINLLILIVFLPRGRVGMMMAFVSLFAWGWVIHEQYQKVFGDSSWSLFGKEWVQKETEKELEKIEESDIESGPEIPNSEKLKNYNDSDLV